MCPLLRSYVSKQTLYDRVRANKINSCIERGLYGERVSLFPRVHMCTLMHAVMETFDRLRARIGTIIV